MQKLLTLFVASLIGVVSFGAYAADDYPKKAIRLVVGFSPGAGGDITSRIMAEALTARLGQPVVVENKPGAGSSIAVDYVSKAAPDGYTLLWGTADAITKLPAVKASIPYKIPDDLSYIGQIVQLPIAIVISSKLPVTSMAEFVAYAKANPGKVRYGSSGVGGGGHFAGLLLEKNAGIKMTHVPYGGSAAALKDLLGGFIEMAVPSAPAAAPNATSDKVRIIAVTSPKRVAVLPDVPPLAEAGYPGATIVTWGGVFGPPGLPADILNRLREAVKDAINDPKTKDLYAKSGWELSPAFADESRKSIVEELEKWKALAKSENIVLKD
jgi:tripartite-type tricarboxylate transporter receptor subunit TctC